MNILEQTYTNHFGIDFANLPSGQPFPKTSAALNIWKKHRLFAEKGLVPDCPPVECLFFAIRKLFPSFKFTPWAEIMLTDLTTHREVIFLGPASSGKSHVMALNAFLTYLVDPVNTSVILSSTTKEDLKTRAWSPLKELVSMVRNSTEFAGESIRVLENEYCVTIDKIDGVPESATKRATIRGVSLADDKLQGQHVSGDNPTTLLCIDELSTIQCVEALMTGIVNISTGTDFRFCAAANPDGWNTEISSKFYTPVDGPQSVTPDTGSWISRSGYFVRHLNGLKSPAILQPEKAKEWPFLLNAETVAKHLSRCDNDPNSALFLKMVVGYPANGSGGEATVLDPIVAARERITEPLHAPVFGGRDIIGKAAGIDPAWSPDGDAAVMATVNVYRQEGKVFLDYTQGVHRLPIVSSNVKPVLAQLRDGVIARMQADGGPTVDRMAVDSSGNQSLGDEITSYIGAGCLAVNSSKTASDAFLRAGETQSELKAKARIADRGTEAWVILAEFARAGMVRGLPVDVQNDLCNRRFQRKADGSELPRLKLEPKDAFCKRIGHGSPNETDACALAALAVKERMGIMPYGSVPTQDPSAIIPNAYTAQQQPQGVYTAFDKTTSEPGGHADDFSDIGAFGD